jgi:hypothetical protein
MLVLAMQFSKSWCAVADAGSQGGVRPGALGHGEVMCTLRRRTRKKRRAKAPEGARCRSFKTE